MESQDNTLRYKAAVVLALFVFSRTVLDYYLRDANDKTIQVPIFVETICLTFLLVPTGGLESPFVWYALNPILMACTYLKTFYCWLNLWVYLTASTLVSYKLFNGQDLTLLQLIRDKSYIILVYILVTGVVMLLACLVKKLDEKNETLNQQGQELRIMNEKLQEANVSVKRAMECVMSLYHIIETFTLREGKQNVLSQMVDSATKITESKGAFLWLFPHKNEPSKFIENISSQSLKDALFAYLKGVEPTLIQEPFFNIEVEQVTFRATRVQSFSRFYGFIGIDLSSAANDCSACKKDELLDFLSELVSLFLERQDFKELSSKLIIMEEQNRIANEIHDSVSQRLFSIVCGLHALNLKWHTLDKETLSKQLQLLEQSTQETSKELRSSIYRLSSTKRGEKIFKENLEKYLHDFSQLNNIQVNFDFTGQEDRISSSLKQALYRIVCEATGNAARHGQCTVLEISLTVHGTTLELRIRDNGKGFNAQRILSRQGNRGLGLNNMHILTQTFNGIFELRSTEAKGSELLFKFPLGYNPEQLPLDKKGETA